MKTLYIECNMGVAGDMLMGALLDLIEDRDDFIKRINSLCIPKTEISYRPDNKCGIVGTHVSVKVNGEEEKSDDAIAYEHHYTHEHHHKKDNFNEANKHHVNEDQPEKEHHHSNMHSIISIVNAMDLPLQVTEDIKAVYEIIAEAESQVHGRTVEEVHFHEVGAMDAVADITGCCMLMNEIAPDQIVVSPIKTGFGQVHCAHGIMPVPAPATALILKGIPNSSGSIEGELCTPTGAALIKHFANEFGYQPEMTTDKIGYGMGNKDFPAANCVRVVLGESKELSGPKPDYAKMTNLKSDEESMCAENSELQDQVVELCCNLDDMTPEEIGYATEELLKGKALDVYTIPIAMKKCRPGTILSVLCYVEDKDEVVREIFRYTTTIGIREYQCNRYVLRRSIETKDTEWGPVRIKKSEGYGVKREKPEYEDLKKIAEESGTALREVKNHMN